MRWNLIILLGIVLFLLIGCTEEKIVLKTVEEINQEVQQESDFEPIDYNIGSRELPTGETELEIIGSKIPIYYPNEKGEFKPIEEAKSTKDICNINYLKKDGFHDLFIKDCNLTSVTFGTKLSLVNNLNKDIPIKLDGAEIGSINYKNTFESKEIVIHTDNIFNHNYSHGFNSTDISIQSNQTNAEDAMICDGGFTAGFDNNNYGASIGNCGWIGMNTDVGGAETRMLYKHNDWGSAVGNTITNCSLSWSVTGAGTPDGGPYNINIMNVSKYWDEGNLSGSTGDVSWNERLNGIAWTQIGGDNESTVIGTIENIDALGSYQGDILPQYCQGYMDAVNSGDYLSVGGMILMQDGLDYSTMSRIYVGSTESGGPIIRVTYFEEANPSITNALMNSTSPGQENLTSEDLAMNINCSDANLGPLDWDVIPYQDGVSLGFTLEGTCLDGEYKSIILDSANTTSNKDYSFSAQLTDNTSLVSDIVFSNNITVQNRYTYISAIRLDGLNRSRKYEYQTTANVTIEGENETYVDIDAPGFGLNYISDTTLPTNISLLIGEVNKAEFNDSSTNNNVSDGEVLYVNLEDTLVTRAEINITGYDSSGFPGNITLDVLNNGSVDFMTPDTAILNGSILQNNLFTNKKENETLVFATTGSNERYLNYTIGNLMDYKELSLNISGGVANSENLDSSEYFWNDSYANYTFSTINNEFVWEDFTEGEIPSRWTGSDYNIVTDQYIEASSSRTEFCSSGSVNEDKNYYSQTLDLTRFGAINIKVELSVGASAYNNPDFGSGASGQGKADLYIRDKTTGSSNAIKSLIIGASASASCDEDTDNSDSDTSEWEFRKVGNNLEIYDDGVYSTSIVYDPDHQYEIYSTTHIEVQGETCDCDGSCSCPCQNGNFCGAEGLASSKLLYINATGLTGERLDNFTFGNGTYTSQPIYNFSDNLSSAVLVATELKPSGTDIFYELSPDYGNNWEEVQNGVSHIFDNEGKGLMYRINTTSTGIKDTDGDLSEQAIVTDIRIVVSAEYPQNITADFGYDGTLDWTMTGELNENESELIIINNSVIKSYINDNCDDLFTCKVPLSIYSESGGAITYTDLSADSYINGIELGEDNIEAYLNGCTSCDIPINFSYDSGILGAYGVNFDYVGNEDINITAHNLDYSVSESRIIQVRYSPHEYEFPSEVPGFYPIPKNYTRESITDYNVTPFGQEINYCNYNNYSQGFCYNESIPIVNVSNLDANLDDMNIYLSLNETFTDINIYFDDDINKTGSILLNTTPQLVVENMTIKTEEHLFSWTDFLGFNTSEIAFVDLLIKLDSICSECVVTEGFLDG